MVALRPSSAPPADQANQVEGPATREGALGVGVGVSEVTRGESACPITEIAPSSSAFENPIAL